MSFRTAPAGFLFGAFFLLAFLLGLGPWLGGLSPNWGFWLNRPTTLPQAPPGEVLGAYLPRGGHPEKDRGGLGARFRVMLFWGEKGAK